MKHIMRTQINVARYGTANKWSTICNCKTMIHIMQLQTNELHYATVKNVEHAASANKWSTICNKKQMKDIMLLKKGAHYAIAYKWRTISNCEINEKHYAIINKWSTHCKLQQMKHIMNCKQMKTNMQLQTNEARSANANNRSTQCILKK